MIQEFERIKKVKGELELPGDKSISHRAVIFSSMADGISRIYNLSNGEDVKSTQKCFAKMGVELNNMGLYLEVRGKGFKSFKKPDSSLDAGNSGTTTRLISGILAAQEFESTIIGDESLSSRPMKRIITPLTEMGAKISSTERFTLPLTFYPVGKLSPVNYQLPIASAQVKSAVLIAGLHCEGVTSVIEKLPSRDHTERMLGLKTETTALGRICYSSKENYPSPQEYYVPSDISTAAFFIVLSLLSKNSRLRIKGVSLNGTRTGIIQILKQMGGNIVTENQKLIAGEPFGDIVVRSSELTNINIPGELIPNIIDEIPVLSIAGILTDGEFKIKNASELRGKESDRITAVCQNLKILGLKVEEYEDGYQVSGQIKNDSPVFESFGDHRIAMSFGILSLLLKKGGKINNFDCVNISNPDFINQIKKIASF